MTDFYDSTVKGFQRNEKNGFVYYTSPLIKSLGIAVHGFTARKGGVSPAPFDTLNFSSTREKNHENILRNYTIVAENFGLDVESFVVENYAHGFAVIGVGPADQGKGIRRENTLPFADGLSTQDKTTTLVTLHADCLPLFFVDPVHRAITMCHAGWKGIYSHIVLKTVDFMRETYGSDPAEIVAAVGPSIGPCCFEVQHGVFGLFRKEFGEETVSENDGRMFVDLWKACVADMQAAGLSASHINVAELCTYCRQDVFFSHRRDHGRTGAMMALLKLI